MNLHTVFLRETCVLPGRFHLTTEPFCKGWSAATWVVVSELDTSIRGAGWHFMWITDSHSFRGVGRTAETAIHRALVRALKEVKGRFNAAELSSFQISNCLGLQIARVTLDTRHIQKQASLDSAAESRLQEVLAL
ncbi:MAG: hypothetical protein WBE72_14085 [Terracidiphilus sp.]